MCAPVPHSSFHSLIVHSVQTLQMQCVRVCVRARAPVNYTNEIFNYDSCVVQLSRFSVFLIKARAMCIVVVVVVAFLFVFFPRSFLTVIFRASP